MFLAWRCNISNSPGLIRVYFRIGGLPRFETSWREKKQFENFFSSGNSYNDNVNFDDDHWLSP